MKVLFIFDSNRKDDYANQLMSAYKLLKNSKSIVDKCSLKSIDNKKISADIIVSNYLNINIQKKITDNKIILIYIEEYKYNKNCDLLIDYKYKKNSKYFTGSKYKIKNNKRSLDFIAMLNVINKLKWDTSF